MDDASIRPSSLMSSEKVWLVGYVSGFKTVIGIHSGEKHVNVYVAVDVFVQGLPPGLRIVPTPESADRTSDVNVVIDCQGGAQWTVSWPETSDMLHEPIAYGHQSDLSAHLTQDRSEAICTLRTGIRPSGDDGHRLRRVLEEDAETMEWSGINRVVRRSARGNVEAGIERSLRQAELIAAVQTLVKDAQTANTRLKPE